MADRLPYIKDLASWLGIAWIIAFLAGLWGVMIGVGKFGLSEFLFLICGAIVLIKVGHETMRHRTKKRLIALIGCLLFVSATEYSVIRWTGGLAFEAAEQKRRLAQLDQIPTLTNQLSDLKNAQAVAQAKSQQQVEDIGKENLALKASIEKKDAALVQIAKAQYSLNFIPQVVVVNEGTADEIQIVNNGKTNANVYEIDIEGVPQDTKTVPALVISGTKLGFRLNVSQERAIANRVLGGTGERIPIECTALLQTLDMKRYSLGFTWFFNAKDGVLTKSDVVDHPIAEIK